LLAGQQLSKDSLVVFTLSENIFVTEVLNISAAKFGTNYPFRLEAFHL